MVTHLKTYFTHKKSLAIGAVFITFGILFGNWATLIPFVKQKYSLNDAELGLLLLSMPLGSTVANPLAAVLINRFGMRYTTTIGVVFLSLFYTIPLSVNHVYLVSVGLVLVGISLSITNVAMNTCVTAIEHEDGISIMSTCHGMFSAGLMLGSVMASILIGFKIPAHIHMLSVASAMILLAFYVRPIIMTIHEEKVEEESGSKFSFPKGALLMMVLISICTNITEGSMADWTAVYMRDVVQTNDYFIGWGLAGYSMFMALGRFMGDSLIPRYGTNNILKVGGITSAIGLALAILFPYTITAIVGFAMVGAGVSCGAPILYGSAARVPNMAKGAGLATMNTFSMLGFLAGPVFIGFISKSVSLQFAFAIIAALGLVWAFLVGKVKLY